MTFTNVGDIPHTATAFDKGKIGDWDTGALAKGESKTITFDRARHLLSTSARRTRGCTGRSSSSNDPDQPKTATDRLRGPLCSPGLRAIKTRKIFPRSSAARSVLARTSGL